MGRLALGNEPVLLRAVSRGGDGPRARVRGARGRSRRSSSRRLSRERASAFASRSSTAWPSRRSSIGTASPSTRNNDGNGEDARRARKRIRPTRSRCATARASTGITRTRTASPPGRCAADCWGCSWSRTTTNSRCARALALVPGETEIPLRPARSPQRLRPSRTRPSPSDLLHGWYGDEALVNFTPRPYRDVGARRYRLRVLNGRMRASSGWDSPATAAAALAVPAHRHRRRPARATHCGARRCFVAPAERVDLLVDFAGLPVGSFVLLDSRAFDPMHAELAARRGTEPSAGTADHRTEPAPGSTMAASHGDGGAFALLQFRVRERGARTAGRARHACRRCPPSRRVHRRRPAAAPRLRQGTLADQRPRLRRRRNADRRRAQHRRDVADPQLPHQHAARDAPARLPVSRAGAGKRVPISSRRSSSTATGGWPRTSGRRTRYSSGRANR